MKIKGFLYRGKTFKYTFDKLVNSSAVKIKENGIITEEVYNYNLELSQLNFLKQVILCLIQLLSLITNIKEYMIWIYLLPVFNNGAKGNYEN